MLPALHPTTTLTVSSNNVVDCSGETCKAEVISEEHLRKRDPKPRVDKKKMSLGESEPYSALSNNILQMQDNFRLD